MSKLPLRAVLGLTLLLPLPILASSGDVRPEALARRADRVVRARVVAQAQEPGPAGLGGVLTVSTLEVTEVLEGGPITELQLVQLGGAQGAERSRVVGDASVKRGEEAVWFLRCRDPEAPTRCTLVGLSAGRLPWNPRTREVRLAPGAAGPKGRTIGIDALRKQLDEGAAR